MTAPDTRVPEPLAGADAAAREVAEAAHRRIRRVLDTIDQGLFTIDGEGRLGDEISDAALRWFGAPARGATAWDWLRAVDPSMASWLELGWQAHREGLLPSELTLTQLPTELSHADRHYAIRWLAFDDDAELLAVVSDVTERRAAELVERVQRETVAVLGRMVRDRQGFYGFLGEGDAIARALASDVESDAVTAARRIHTLKGNASMFGLTTIAERCHAVESRIREHEGVLLPEDRAALIGAWREFRRRIEPFLSRTTTNSLQIPRARVEALLAAVIAHRPLAQIERELRSWTFEPTRIQLERLAEQAKALALRLGKGDIAVRIQDHGLALPPGPIATIWPVLTHVVRNSVDHGLETGEERAAAGKSGFGQLWLATAMVDGELVISIRDDGRGIDWRRVAERARAAGLPWETQHDLEVALVTDGVSTADLVTEISGRGVGLAAVEATAQALRGRLCVHSDRGEGTTFELRLPGELAGGAAGVRVAA